MTDEREDGIVVTRNVEEELKNSYLRYSMSVIISRALPDVRDGLKPSQRRILFAMRQLNLGPSAKHRKCAKICGDTSGDYHPHGETVIYPTLVRMAQEWAMGYCLVNGQGNFGSVDGDPPAAMRYTEARLTQASVQLMDDLDKETVDYVPNYDETKKEPTVFPSKFPNLLCNGSSGIAVGMATNIPPHNFNEVVAATLLFLDNPLTSLEEVQEVLPGPDFPTGGIICGYRGIKEAFSTGRGKLIVRGIISIEEQEKQKDRQRLVVTELPYNVNKARLIQAIAEHIQEKTITAISDIRDESDRNGMRIVMELKRGEVPEVVINQLYKHSDLEVTFGCNMLALSKGLPRMMGIRDLILYWIEHRIEVIRRRTAFELKQAEARAHILEGYLKALDHLDEVVRLIRNSDSKELAKDALIARFSFTERQAKAILELRLYQLTSLEHGKITDEYNLLLERIAYYKAVLASESKVKEIIREELMEISKFHKQERRTKIEIVDTEVDIEDLIKKETAIITISEDDYIKRMSPDLFREQRRGGQGVSGIELKKENDAVKELHIATTHDHLLIFTQTGRVYQLKVWKIPEGGRKAKGKPLVNLVELQEGEKIATILQVESFTDTAYVFLCTKKGVVKKMELDNFSSVRRNGIIALNIDEGDELIAARLVHQNQEMMLFTKDGMAVRFNHEDVRAMGRTARGVKGVTLKGTSDCVVGCETVTGEDTIMVTCENGYGKRSLVEDFRKTKRGGVGVRSIIASERNGSVISAVRVKDTDGLLLITSSGKTIRISLNEVRVMGRNTQGVKLIQCKDDAIVAVQRIQAEVLNESKETFEPLPEIIPESEEALEQEVLEENE